MGKKMLSFILFADSAQVLAADPNTTSSNFTAKSEVQIMLKKLLSMALCAIMVMGMSTTMAGGAAAGVGIVFPVMAPVADSIAAGAAFDAGYWWLLATRIDANNQGKGTITNMTHVLIFDIIPQ